MEGQIISNFPRGLARSLLADAIIELAGHEGDEEATRIRICAFFTIFNPSVLKKYTDINDVVAEFLTKGQSWDEYGIITDRTLTP
jgi:hypothetical protein